MVFAALSRTGSTSTANRPLLAQATGIWGATLIVLIVATPPVQGADYSIPGDGQDAGFISLTYEDAQGFPIPSDMELVTKGEPDDEGFVEERYQQYFHDVRVEGAQLTVLRDAQGKLVSVLGRHYPGLQARTASRFSQREAISRGAPFIYGELYRTAEVLFDPEEERFVYLIENGGMMERWFTRVDAASGEIIDQYDGIKRERGATGVGVLGDTKRMDNLTKKILGSYYLKNSRQNVYDCKGKPWWQNLFPSIATDDNDKWVRKGWQSPGQPALVDAAYYSNLSDHRFRTVHGIDLLNLKGGPSKIKIAVHLKPRKDHSPCSAFFNGTYLVFYDGDNINCRNYSGAADVVGHEFTHLVIDYTAKLAYLGESGAIEEALCDIIGSAVERNYQSKWDWKMGVDVDLTHDESPGRRHLADPEREKADEYVLSDFIYPDHYSERYSGGEDNGGVHVNSTIMSHAFYLLVTGGINASCRKPEQRRSEHCIEPLWKVNKIKSSDAEKIFVKAITSLTEKPKTLCDARSATLNKAEIMFPDTLSSVRAAWNAVGVCEDPKPVQPTAPLNDTGIDWCADGTRNFLPCPVAGFPWQDAQHGRDATHNNDSDGHAGFSFTKISNSGKTLPNSATLGNGPNDWGCTRDNVTGLIWEVKTDDGGLRDNDWTYSWYNPDASTNGGFEGYADHGTCSGGINCDTESYLQAVNAQGLCGAYDWRIPDRRALLSIVSYDRFNPSIDSIYFPNTLSDSDPSGNSSYWSSSTASKYTGDAWHVGFFSGDDAIYSKSFDILVRLVRDSR